MSDDTKYYALLVAYEGTHYLGWQKTKEGPSIEDTLSKALETIVRHPVTLEAASRTDRGVHAEGQMVTCCVSSPIPIERLQHRLNSILPPSIRVMEMSPSTAHFHPSLHAIKKEYHYSTDTSSVQTPFHKEFSWHFPYPLDLHKMLEASKYFIGEHDFAAFANHGTHDHTLRVVHQIGISEGPVHVFSVVGESFLYKMVRNLVGTLVYVGCGKLKIEDIPLILESKSRSLAGMCAPAHGLTLKRIYY